MDVELSLRAAAAEAPREIALVAGDEEISYAELARRVRRILPALRRATAGAERVALVGETDLATLEVLYGLFELGRPVALVHPRWSPRERHRFLEACAPLVEIEPAALEKSELSELSDLSNPSDKSCLAVVPTSGSSGRPKGVVLARRAFVAAAEASAENLGWQSGDRWLLSLPIAHVGGLSVLTRCLIARRTAVIHRGERFAAAEVVRVIERHRVTLLSLVPTTLRRLLALEPPQRLPETLRAVLLGGAAASLALLKDAAARGWPIYTTYGLTEASSQVTTERYGAPRGAPRGCGPPLAGMEVRIRDGTVEVRGPQLMDGYLGAVDEAPFSTDGWLQTGDLGRLDEEGCLHVLGRRRDVVISGGENVLVAEVEEVLEEHPAIAAACAFGVDDAEWGEVVAAGLVAAAEEPVDDELAAFLRERLARFKLPRRVAYLPKLLVLPSGKVDRRRTAAAARLRLRTFSAR